MDSVVAQLLARLSMFLYQELDFQIETQRFSENAEYAAQVLDLIDEMHDHEFKMVAEQIRKRQLHLFSLKNTASSDGTVNKTPPLASDPPAPRDKRL
ncbi:MAG: hypothetical protein JWM03_1672 [Rhodocyclales bacterium]|nr:hypothetical protein [Rhodocyclales bacterium]